jgi:hypothetical protein
MIIKKHEFGGWIKQVRVPDEHLQEAVKQQIHLALSRSYSSKVLHVAVCDF